MKIVIFLILIVVGIRACSHEVTSYDVYYWQNVTGDNSENNKYIGTTDSLADCQNLAINHAKNIHETWNYRSYICVRMIAGNAISKHRYGDND